MKALSLTQPWADVILEQGKRVENRVDRGPWRGGCSYRGPILLHASLGLGTYYEIDERVRMIRAAGVPNEWIEARLRDTRSHSSASLRPTWKARPALRLGGVVGRAEIVDALEDHPTTYGGFAGHLDFLRRTRPNFVNQTRWWFGGFALILDHVEPLPFVPWKGALGLFEIPDDYATRAA